jgi:hypothetical protein
MRGEVSRDEQPGAASVHGVDGAGGVSGEVGKGGVGTVVGVVVGVVAGGGTNFSRAS